MLFLKKDIQVFGIIEFMELLGFGEYQGIGLNGTFVTSNVDY